MAYYITDDCMACGHCSVVCPEDAIEDGYTNFKGQMTPGKKKYADTYFITDNCTDCGACLEVCPTEAIVRES